MKKHLPKSKDGQNMKPLFIQTISIILLIASSWTAPKHALSKSYALSKPNKVTKTLSGQIDMCLSCHFETPDKAHGRKVLGCFVCHLGNPLSGDPDIAHQGVVLNPGDLRVVNRTCGQEGCHVEQVKQVKNTLMATNRGIISTLRFYWGETKDQNEPVTVEMLLKNRVAQSLALDYFRKLCGTCHLWLPKNTLPGFLSEKGGGCTACHYSKGPIKDRRKKHPLITKKIPMKNCVRCHNRSGRIGLSYQGLYESEGYGTPFEDGDLSSLQLDDGRFVQEIHPDIHFKKGLICIDCHNQKEIMGDGKQHAHLYEQVEIRCVTCHGGKDELVKLLNEQNSNKRFPTLNNLVKATSGQIVLKGKTDEKLHELRPFSEKACRNEQHKSLSCQACHSPWVPQCYGCHVRYDRGKTQLDKLSLNESFGHWQEFRSYMRYESPVLGVLKKDTKSINDKVVILVPG